MKMENLLGGIFPTDGMGIPARIPPLPSLTQPSSSSTMLNSRAKPQKLMSSTKNLIHDQDVEGSLLSSFFAIE